MLWIGTSGWQYDDWRGRFYPERSPARLWLSHYAAAFRTVELNSSFYRLPAGDTFAAWARDTPADFVFATKASRYLSHMKRLRDPEQPVARLLAAARRLGAKLGPVLVQLPATMACDPDRLAHLLAVWPDDHRLALELRHPSWFTADTYAALRRHDVALCFTDVDGRPQGPLERTADWGYVRLHRGTAAPRPCYGDGALSSWIVRISQLYADRRDVFVFFNNDPRACAVANAARFGRLADTAGRHRTRTPEARDVTPG
ncbi:DUF72 domain-containing protein [Nannocystis bainbridge]|uniref:DUF72 domain-containing protein n=1 Tax=Nannocystis bainbridge TaxID=2995303 RepID=A0ABT5DYD7_9BACT|nr:DUF72 domain-containing protein [Nannocystis bainbridge]MDC0717452.1 DUF72 domain-containing protein [Nannocystis bainbridge]